MGIMTCFLCLLWLLTPPTASAPRMPSQRVPLHSRAARAARAARATSIPPAPLASLLQTRSHQMPRQEEIRNPLLDLVLMPTAPTHQPALLYTRLEQHTMQIPRRLARQLIYLLSLLCILDSAFDEIIGCGRRGRQVGKPELTMSVCVPGCEGGITYNTPLCKSCADLPTSAAAGCFSETAGSGPLRGSRAPSPAGAAGRRMLAFCKF
jgi:hypothetical protein